MSKKVHLAKGDGFGGRSVCRYTSRPSRRVRLLVYAQFVLVPESLQCSECAREAEKVKATLPEGAA